MAIAVHPYISGVPHRIKYFEKTFAYLKKQRGVLFWTGEEIWSGIEKSERLKDKKRIHPLPSAFIFSRKFPDYKYSGDGGLR
jgi:hypothetical protein